MWPRVFPAVLFLSFFCNVYKKYSCFLLHSAISTYARNSCVDSRHLCLFMLFSFFLFHVLADTFYKSHWNPTVVSPSEFCFSFSECFVWKYTWDILRFKAFLMMIWNSRRYVSVPQWHVVFLDFRTWWNVTSRSVDRFRSLHNKCRNFAGFGNRL